MSLEEARKNVEDLRSKLDEWNSILDFSNYQNIYIVNEYSVAREEGRKGEIFDNIKYRCRKK